MKAPYAVSFPMKLAAIQRLVTIVKALPMPKPRSMYFDEMFKY